MRTRNAISVARNRLSRELLEAERRIRDDRLSRAIDETARTHGCRALEEAIRDRDRAVDELVLVKAAQHRRCARSRGASVKCGSGPSSTYSVGSVSRVHASPPSTGCATCCSSPGTLEVGDDRMQHVLDAIDTPAEASRAARRRS